MPPKKSANEKIKTRSNKVKNQEELIQKLLESNLESQKKQIELMLEFKNLSLKVDSLVNLFADATKLIKKGEEPLSKKVDRLVSLFNKAAQNIEKGEYRDPLMNEIKKLTKQNQDVSRGLLLLEKYVRDKAMTSVQPMMTRKFQPKPLIK